MTVEDRPDLKVGATFNVSMHWQLGGPEKMRAWATFLVEIEAIDVNRNRLFCRLESLLSLRTNHRPETLDQDMLARIKGLVGQYAYIPPEAADGITLHLKPTTLTGAHRYFLEKPSSLGDEEREE